MIGRTGEPLRAQNESVRERLMAVFQARIRQTVSLAPMTTFKVGGAADWFLDSSDPTDVVQAVEAGRQLGLPVTVLGGGSNVLVGKGGVRGLVVRLWHGGVSLVRPGVVRADAGVSLNGLVRWTVNRGLAGLARWSGTPGTVGGALHGNAHFQGELIGNQVVSVGVVDPTGAISEIDGPEMQFGYDTSRLQQGREAALWAEFSVSEGGPGDTTDGGARVARLPKEDAAARRTKCRLHLSESRSCC